jgi:hypothetical protein
MAGHKFGRISIDILLLFNFAVVFHFNVFPIPPSKAKLICIQFICHCGIRSELFAATWMEIKKY